MERIAELMNNEFPIFNILKEDFEECFEDVESWMSIDGTTVLVTGASGLIGSFLVYLMAYRNAVIGSNIRVIAIARNVERLQQRFMGLPGVEIVGMDVCSPLSYDGRADYIIHAACDVQPRTKSTNPVGTAKTIMLGMFNVCELAKTKGSKVILMSSVDVYGKQDSVEQSSGGVRIDLSDSGYVYHEGKRMAEMICASYADQFGVEYSALRISRVYGPTMNPTDSMVLSSFLFDASMGKDIKLQSNGKQMYSYVYVSDVARAIILLMKKGHNRGYDCGNGDKEDPMPFGWIVDMIAEVNGVSVIRKTNNDNDSSIYSKTVYSVLNSDSLIKLGWTKKTDIKTGIKKTSCILKELYDGKGF